MLFPIRLRSAPADASAIERQLERGGNNFNFLRLLLAALVLVSHSFELIDGNRSREPLTTIFHTLSFGELAVNGFFLLSGFLIVRSWQGNPTLLDYFKKRVLRIYPGFVAAFLIGLFVVGALGSALPPAQYYRTLHLPRQLLFLFSLQSPGATAVYQDQPYFNGSMWTIAYEFRCYVLVAILGLIGFIDKRYLWLGLTGLMLVLCPLRRNFPTLDFPGGFYLLGFTEPLIRLTTFFLAGGCFFLFLRHIRFNDATALLFSPIIILTMFNIYAADVVLATLGAYLLFWFAFLPVPLLNRFKHHSDVSYGLYLYGWPVQKLLLWYLPTLSPYALFPLSLILSYVCGYVSWKGIERPALGFKRRTPRDPRIVSA